jgi:hypothetical protein
MPADDPFKRYQEAGADFLEIARARVDEFFNQFARMGGYRQTHAQGAIDDMVEGSRRGSEMVINAIREEIAAQLSLFGIATTRDLEDLERRLIARFSTQVASTPVPPAVPAVKKAAPAKKRVAKKEAPAQKAAPAKKAAGKKGAAKKAGPARHADLPPEATGEA